MVCYIFMHIINDFVQNHTVKMCIFCFVLFTSHLQNASCSRLIPTVTHRSSSSSDGLCVCVFVCVFVAVRKDPIRHSSPKSNLTEKVVCPCPSRALNIRLKPRLIFFFSSPAPLKARSLWLQSLFITDCDAGTSPFNLLLNARQLCCRFSTQMACQSIENVPTSAS